MYQVTDQIGQTHYFNKPPQRVVSLVPSITYLLHRLDLDDVVLGITRFCKLPAHFKKSKTIIGGTKQVNFDKVKQLRPDLFIISKEENTKEIADALQSIAPVFVTDVYDCASNKALISSMGQIFDIPEKANLLQAQIDKAKSDLLAIRLQKTYKTLYFIWQNPWMTVGGDTFINQMMQLSGFQNIYADQKRYPTVDLSSINSKNIDVILLSSEPFPFKEKHRNLLQKQFLHAKILLVEGEPFTWFGAYPDIGFRYLQNLLKTIANAH